MYPSSKQAFGSFLRSQADKQLGAKGRERDYLSKLRKGPQVNEETKEEVEKLALEVNDR